MPEQTKSITVRASAARVRLLQELRTACYREQLWDTMPSQTDVILYSLEQLASLVLPPEVLALFDWVNGQVVGMRSASTGTGKRRVSK